MEKNYIETNDGKILNTDKAYIYEREILALKDLEKYFTVDEKKAYIEFLEKVKKLNVTVKRQRTIKVPKYTAFISDLLMLEYPKSIGLNKSETDIKIADIVEIGISLEQIIGSTIKMKEIVRGCSVNRPQFNCYLKQKKT